MLESFHPAVAAWFARRFPDGPTDPQAQGWAEIAAGRHTLIAAPTGSGKTLAAFLVCIDRLYRAHEAAVAEAAVAEAASRRRGQGHRRDGAGAARSQPPGRRWCTCRR